jgi:hypothetical protein
MNWLFEIETSKFLIQIPFSISMLTTYLRQIVVLELLNL